MEAEREEMRRKLNQENKRQIIFTCSERDWRQKANIPNSVADEIIIKNARLSFDRHNQGAHQGTATMEMN